jgi:ABC-type taurine transport system ATPase subunit
MLTKLRIRNFKLFEDVEIELGQTVVFIGPNNSGKTTALQALALWSAAWKSHRTLNGIIEGKYNHDERVYINRGDLVFMPLPDAQLLWRRLQVDNRGDINDQISIDVEGSTETKTWRLGFHFGYFNPDVIAYLLADYPDSLVKFPQIAFLTPMSGLAATEPLLQPGRINVLIGEGRTAEILRNLCLLLYEANGKLGYWDRLVAQIRQQFDVELLPPQYDSGRGEIRTSYKERSGISLDLSAAGRGMLQVLLLLAYMYNNPGAVLLLDEPDAHLEILRQGQVYRLLNEVGQETSSQIIIATHSEVVLDLAAGRDDTIIGFIGKPHKMRKLHNLRKSLSVIPTEDYFLAEQKGWVLYLEGTTDLDILRAFSEHLKHKAANYLQLAFLKDIEKNEPKIAKSHFTGLQEAIPNLLGIALFDRISKQKLKDVPAGLTLHTWKRREIENYLGLQETLLAFARTQLDDSDAAETVMKQAIEEVEQAFTTLGEESLWSPNRKVSERGLPAVFENFYTRIGLPNRMLKANYHLLVSFIPTSQIDPEVTEKLDAIAAVAKRAQPRED